MSGGFSGSGAQCKAPVPMHVARDFLDALVAEYERGEAGAVGDWYDREDISATVQNVLDPYEDRVREATDRAVALRRLAM